jgi:hypothetical protein
MSADPIAVRDSVDRVLTRQLDEQSAADKVQLTLRFAGADDIIDKATMSHAVSDSSLVIGKEAAEAFIARHRKATEDPRPMAGDVAMVAWVTPLIKDYNQPGEHLQRHFGVTPFAGLRVTGVHLDPPAIGIAGLGTLVFPPTE